ncbi:8849_t:CDS:2, partial [Scutellospora calospora]
LVIHERIKHRNNKIIPHRYSLIQPSLEQIMFYQDAFIVLIKKCLGFNRHSIGTKQVSINAFPENIFVYLFENEPSFRYSPVQRKYFCLFQGEVGEQRLKQLVNYDYWNVRQDPKLKTIGYVLFMDNESSYKVTFSWSQTELKENDRIFQCGTASCKFVADFGEFSELPTVTQTNQVTPQQALNLPQIHDVDSSKNILNNISSQRSYRFILPRVPFQQLNK